MDEIKLSLWEKFIISLYKFKESSQLIKESTGKAFLYLFILTIILGSVSIAPTIVAFNQGMNYIGPEITNELPDFELKNGTLSVDKEMPIVIGDERTKIIIDTTDNTKIEDIKDYSQIILLTKTKMYQKNLGQVQNYDYSFFGNTVINKAYLLNLIPKIRNFGYVIIIVFGLLIYFIGKVISALIISVIGQIVNSSLHLNIDYSKIFSLSIYALTAPMLIKSIIVRLAHVNIPFFGFLYYLVASMYIYLALSEMKKQSSDITPIDMSY